MPVAIKHYHRNTFQPVLVVDNNLNEFLHLLCQLDRIWARFLERRSSTFLGFLTFLFGFITIIVFNTPTSFTSFLSDFILHLVQIAVLNRLRKQTSSEVCNNYKNGQNQHSLLKVRVINKTRGTKQTSCDKQFGLWASTDIKVSSEKN